MALIQQQRFNPATGQVESVFVDTDTGSTVATMANGGGATPLPSQGGSTPTPGTPPTGPPQQVPFGAGSPGAQPANFQTRHPKLHGFLEALGPALAALNIEPQQPTPYRVSGAAGALQAVGRGAQTFTKATENIKGERTKKAIEKLSGPAIQKVAGGAPLESLSSSDIYGLQLGGLPAPPALGGAEQRQAALNTGGITLTAAQKAEQDTQNRKIDAETTYQGKLLGLQQQEIDARKTATKQQVDISRAEAVSRAVAQGIPGSAASDLFNSVYNGTKLSAETEKALADNPSANLVRAQATAAAAKVRGQTLVGNIVDLINKKPGLTDDQKLQLQHALLRIQSLTADSNIFLNYSPARDEYERARKVIDALMPEAKNILPTSDNWFKQAWDAIAGISGVSEQAAPAAGNPGGAAPTTETPDVTIRRLSAKPIDQLTPEEKKQLSDALGAAGF